MNITKNINEFLKYMQVQKNSSLATLKNYKCDLDSFSKWCESQSFASFQEIKLSDLRKYVLTLENASAKTIRRRISSLSSFFKYLCGEDLCEYNPARDLEKPKLPKKKMNIIDEDDSYFMVRAIEDNLLNDYVNSYRDYTMVKLLFAVGIRREEIVNIQLGDLNLKQNELLINGKGNKQRYVYLNEELTEIIKEYLTVHRIKVKTAQNSLYMFPSAKSPKMSVNSVNNIINKFMEQAGCKEKGRSTHTLRKRAATNMYNHTKDIYVVAEMLGHDSIETTKIYAEQSKDNIKNAFMSVK